MSSHPVIDLCSDEENNDDRAVSRPSMIPKPQAQQSLQQKLPKADSSGLASRVAELLAQARKVPKGRAKSVDIRIRKSKAQQRSKRRPLSSPPALSIPQTNFVAPVHHNSEQLASTVINGGVMRGGPEGFVNNSSIVTREEAHTSSQAVHHGEAGRPIQAQMEAQMTTQETVPAQAAGAAPVSPSSTAATSGPLTGQPAATVSSPAPIPPSSATSQSTTIDLTLSPSPPPPATLPQSAPASTVLGPPPPLPAPLPPSSTVLARIPLAPPSPSPPPRSTISASTSTVPASNQNQPSPAQNPPPPARNATAITNTAAAATAAVTSAINQTARPRSRPWTAAQVAALATQLQHCFDFEAFANAHGKTQTDVLDVFSAVVQMPLLRFSERGMDRARRMREFRQVVRDFRGERKAVVGGINKASVAGRK